MTNEQLEKIQIKSSADGTLQPSLILPATGKGPRPLLIGLHTWSYGVDAPCGMFAERCKIRDWHFIFPHFRGPNWTPEACGTALTVADIVDARQYMIDHYDVDLDRIYLTGGSGGGHESLLVASLHPELWSAVSAWCPITDVARWHREGRARGNGYPDHIETACGGNPQTDANAKAEAWKRSSLAYLEKSSNRCIVDIGTGIHDGHTGSVPVGHAIRGFNALAAPEDRISEEDIAFIEQNERIPENLRFAGVDPAYGDYTVYLRRVSRKVRLTLFEGGHNILCGPGFGFLERQRRSTPPLWESGFFCDAQTDSELTK